MRMLTFAKRTLREILRDPLTLIFGLGFPGILILLLGAISASVPESSFETDSLAPGMTVFGLSFMTLFSATVIAKDREGALLMRLYATPMTASDFIFGYTLPFLPIALVQGAFCYGVGALMGLKITVNVLWALIITIPSALFFIALGLLFGSVLTQKQTGGICGALLTNLTAWLSGIWFDPVLVGGAFKTIADALPFSPAVRLAQLSHAGDFSAALPHLIQVSAYAVLAVSVAVWLFLHQMKKQ